MLEEVRWSRSVELEDLVEVEVDRGPRSEVGVGCSRPITRSARARARR